MLNCPARLSLSHPKTVIVTVLVLLNAAAAHGSHVGDRLADVGFLNTSSESIRAADPPGPHPQLPTTPWHRTHHWTAPSATEANDPQNALSDEEIEQLVELGWWP